MRVADEGDAVGDGLERPLQAGPGRAPCSAYGAAAGRRWGCRRRRGRGRAGGPARSRRAAGRGRAPRGRRPRRRRSGRARAGRSTRRSARPAWRPRCGAARAPAGCRSSAGPTWSGVIRARRVVRNSRTSAHVWRLSMPSSLGALGAGPAATRGALSVHPSAGTPTRWRALVEWRPCARPRRGDPMSQAGGTRDRGRRRGRLQRHRSRTPPAAEPVGDDRDGRRARTRGPPHDPGGRAGADLDHDRRGAGHRDPRRQRRRRATWWRSCR